MYRMIQVGTGGMGRTWWERFLPDLVEVVAEVDVVPAMLDNARAGLGLPPEHLYTDIHEAFRDHGDAADFSTVVVPPDCCPPDGIVVARTDPIGPWRRIAAGPDRRYARLGLCHWDVTGLHRL